MSSQVLKKGLFIFKLMSFSLRKIFSYLLPVRLHTYRTVYNGELAVTMFNGKKMLDTAVSNYSYGSLQRILHKALQRLPFDRAAREVLVLGMGAGSVVATIREGFHSSAHITLVEIDADIISIAETEFELTKFSNITIVHEDALVFMEANKKRFDLVIVDLFIIDVIPGDCRQPLFLGRVAGSLCQGGQLVYNTIADTLPKEEFNTIAEAFRENGIDLRVLRNVQGSNNVILGRKI